MSGSENNTVFNNRIFDNQYGIYLFSGADGNIIYNNLFNNTQNYYIVDSSNTWNVTKQEGTNIIGGSYIGGNAWLKPDGTGFSQTCNDTDGDGICDEPYQLDSNNIDFLPLCVCRPALPPVASFTFTSSSPTVNETVTFNASDSYDPDGSIVEYIWNFGDGTEETTTNPIVQHVYTTAGVYTVTLTVVDDDGLNSTVTETLEVTAVSPPNESVNATTSETLQPLPGHTKPPKDLDGDGVVEDFNGNGILDFDDVVELYKNMDWIKQNYPLSKVDQNGDNRLDFDDVIAIFRRI